MPGSTVKSNRDRAKRHLIPKLGHLKVPEVTRADIADLMKKMAKSPVSANRMLAMCRKMFNVAEVWGLRPDGSNPCRHVPKYPERGKTRLITDAEMRKLFEYLDRADAEGLEHPFILLAIRLGSRSPDTDRGHLQHVENCDAQPPLRQNWSELRSKGIFVGPGGEVGSSQCKFSSSIRSPQSIAGGSDNCLQINTFWQLQNWRDAGMVSPANPIPAMHLASTTSAAARTRPVIPAAQLVWNKRHAPTWRRAAFS
ncbi:hypothetical protein [Paracoccus sp. S3-43]|uniref:hypothetical protein n=1 Tax=Paracoccus sp. S3-43 TaxID=3030011 RepID=UPI0023AF03C5|nr:hypothetical protein [Paracoccus sp. S3-43]WEF25017.1 hypothetical protein PXD02_03400 [Paracoccus sp. S3-43]